MHYDADALASVVREAAARAGAEATPGGRFARADPVGVYSVAVSRLAPFRRNRGTGRVVIGNPLDHLPTMPVRPGTVAVMAVLLGSTAFDSFSQSKAFRNFVDRNAAAVPFLGDTGGGSVLRTAGLLLFVVVVGVSFTVAARATGGVTAAPVSYTHLRAHETVLDLVCRLLLEKKKKEHTTRIVENSTRN